MGASIENRRSQVALGDEATRHIIGEVIGMLSKVET